MNEDQAEEAVVRAFTARGLRAVTSAQWTRQGALDVVRENRRRYADHPRMKGLEQFASDLADRLSTHTDVPAQDIATVLLAAGATAGAFALMHDLSGPVVTEIMQIAADDLDRRTDGGEAS
ncbi:hypothetical protein RI578_06775 [Streptomyces sp. BB1-1-1]|uniref:hypothetical protein n=1 Tax=Streptomyces sp. BB1-1-1 TaxID=3074430 RepID=UPI0028779E71|nr:hypothetical protein [Streptomyces sp. BB1-1-1]WND34017.1 hypothetical protein RI578_06775 [Streptomyces sp. BB1-1-1]